MAAIWSDFSMYTTMYTYRVVPFFRVFRLNRISIGVVSTQLTLKQ